MQPQDTANRRAHDRLPLRVPVSARCADGTVAGPSEDLSIGGAKLRFGEGKAPEIGEQIEVQVALPGNDAPLQATAKVRWHGAAGSCGVSFDRKAQAVLSAFFAAMCTLSSATAVAATAVPTFDPNATVEVQDTGGERPDEHVIEGAFKAQNEALDQCVKQTKGAIKGKAKVEVLLNPAGNRPLGINAMLPKKLRSNAALRECVRTATAAAPFPAYDGPPVMVDLDFQIDPGSDVEEVW